MEDRCVICGDKIPEGRQVCPNCSGNEAGVFESLMKRKDIQFEINDAVEQAFRDYLFWQGDENLRRQEYEYKRYSEQPVPELPG